MNKALALREAYKLTENDILRDIKESLNLGERSLVKLSEVARYMGIKEETARLELRDVPKVNIGVYGRYHIRALARFVMRNTY